MGERTERFAKPKPYIGQAHGALPMTPNTGMYESALEKAAAGMNEIGKGLAEVAKVGENIYKKHKEIKRENDLQAMQLESEKQFLTFKTGYDRSDPDPTDYAKGIEKGWDEIIKGQLNTSKDAETRRAYQNRMDGRKLMEITKAHVEGEQRFNNQYFSDSMRNVDECKNMAIETDDPDRAEMFKQMMTEELEKGYPFTEDQARKEAEKALAEIKTKRAENALNRVKLDILRDPGGTLQKLMLPAESGSYTEITDPLLREQLKKGAEEIFQHKQTEQRTEGARIKKENLDAEEFQIEGLYATGKLKIDDIWASKFIDKAKWTDRIRARQDREKLGVPIKTNFSTYAKIQDMIFSGQPKAEIVKTIALASEKDLGEQDAETLLNKSTAYQGHIEDQWRKKSYDYLKSQIAGKGTNMIGEFVDPEEAIDFFKATNSLDSAIAKAKQQGKPFSPEQIFEEARKTLPLFKRTQKQLAEAAKERMRGEKPKSNIPAREKGESASDYLKRTEGK